MLALINLSLPRCALEELNPAVFLRFVTAQRGEVLAMKRIAISQSFPVL